MYNKDMFVSCASRILSGLLLPPFSGLLLPPLVHHFTDTPRPAMLLVARSFASSTSGLLLPPFSGRCAIMPTETCQPVTRFGLTQTESSPG